jgi:hypothetical protein
MRMNDECCVARHQGDKLIISLDARGELYNHKPQDHVFAGTNFPLRFTSVSSLLDHLHEATKLDNSLTHRSVHPLVHRPLRLVPVVSSVAKRRMCLLRTGVRWLPGCKVGCICRLSAC